MGEYDTQLTPEELRAYMQWAKTRGRLRDEEDYDMRGYYKKYYIDSLGPHQEGEGHFPDTWKKPNHPTFSDESIYHNKNGNQGGHWGDGYFQPGATNYKYRNRRQLEEYFNNYEKGVKLK